jgi:hypothetical protein
VNLLILAAFLALAVATFLVAPLLSFTTREEREEAGVRL